MFKTDTGCANCPQVTCEDTTCIIPEQTCFVWCSPIEWNRVSISGIWIDNKSSLFDRIEL